MGYGLHGFWSGNVVRKGLEDEVLPSYSETLAWAGGRQRPCTDCVVAGGMGGPKGGNARKSGVLEEAKRSEATSSQIYHCGKVTGPPQAALPPAATPPTGSLLLFHCRPPTCEDHVAQRLTPLPVNAGR